MDFGELMYLIYNIFIFVQLVFVIVVAIMIVFLVLYFPIKLLVHILCKISKPICDENTLRLSDITEELFEDRRDLPPLPNTYESI